VRHVLLYLQQVPSRDCGICQSEMESSAVNNSHIQVSQIAGLPMSPFSVTLIFANGYQNSFQFLCLEKGSDRYGVSLQKG
jgi:hypothetical protein